MKVGTSLSISLGDFIEDEQSKVYRSKIIDRINHEFIIDYPVETEEYIELPIKPGTKIHVEYVSKGNVYRFQTTVNRMIDSPILSFAIDIPSEAMIHKIQRREYVRIDTDVDIAIHSLTDSFEPFTTVTRDISGGGAAIVLPEKRFLEEGEMVQLYLVLKSKYSDFEYIKVRGEIIRTTIDHYVRTTSLKFHFDDPLDQQKIVKFCFEIQREIIQRQKLS